MIMRITAGLSAIVLSSAFFAEARAAKQGWVLPIDCPVEQEAVRQWPGPAPGATCHDNTGNDTEGSIRASLEHPWIYRYSGTVSGAEKSAEELRSNGNQFDREAEKAVRDGEQPFQSREWAACSASIYRLKACAYRVAAIRKAGGVPPPADKARLPCLPDAVANVNRRIEEIDRRVGAFLASPAGRQQGTATPGLQVVMWATSEQVQAMEQHCAEASAFRQRIDDLQSSFKLAQQACRQIQTRPEVCQPAAPEGLMGP